MPLLQQSREVKGGKVAWSQVASEPLFEIQEYRLGGLGKAARGLKHTIKGNKEIEVGSFRIVTSAPPLAELAVADSRDDIDADADALRLYVAGIPGPEVPLLVKQALTAVAEQLRDTASARGAGEDGPTDSEGNAVALSDSSREHLDKMCLLLLDSSDRLRYVVHALKVAASLSADVATAGLGGEEIVELLFVAVDALAWSSWLTWFSANLLTENSAGTGAVRGILTMSFAGGPDGVMAQAGALAAQLSADQAAIAMRLCNSLKKRVASLVGNLASLFTPEDASIMSVVVTELLIRLTPSDCGGALAKLAGWYGKISMERRRVLQDQGHLAGLIRAGGALVERTVMSEYNRTSTGKLMHGAKRHGVLAAGSVVFPPLMLVNVAHLGASAALQVNYGKESCERVFEALQGDKADAIAAGLQQVLAVSFGVVALLDACSKRDDVMAVAGTIPGMPSFPSTKKA
eukprot:TRINITY_DN11709_c0_g1_i1.p1 TRINITY_DN11709_c0_g1~~TRINITY_DN11709_c0_g1_i1.p1  ORF type:complete len:461 (+),score=101.71 TRINITY_DN11709_c0_g1_i1:67-1449(+)